MDKHSRVNINSKMAENKALNSKENNHNIMEEIASYRAKDSGKTMIDKDIQVNITTKNMEYDALRTKTETPCLLTMKIRNNQEINGKLLRF